MRIIKKWDLTTSKVSGVEVRTFNRDLVNITILPQTEVYLPNPHIDFATGYCLRGYAIVTDTHNNDKFELNPHTYFEFEAGRQYRLEAYTRVELLCRD